MADSRSRWITEILADITEITGREADFAQHDTFVEGTLIERKALEELVRLARLSLDRTVDGVGEPDESQWIAPRPRHRNLVGWRLLVPALDQIEVIRYVDVRSEVDSDDVVVHHITVEGW